VRQKIDLSTNAAGNLEARLNRHPELKDKIVALLSVVENAEGDIVKASAAEERVIEEIRKIGQTALQAWATGQNQVQREVFTAATPQAHRTRQKKSTGTADLDRLKS
jgi:BMFP domain-containing protein YqiC